jgi:hypothetical protein
MKRAAALVKKMALRVTGLAQAQQMRRAIDVPRLEDARAQTQEGRRTAQVVFRQVNVPSDPATVRAARPASEMQSFHPLSIAGPDCVSEAQCFAQGLFADVGGDEEAVGEAAVEEHVIVNELGAVLVEAHAGQIL